MVSVIEVVTEFCKNNDLPAPSQKDFRNAGQFIGTHFRRFWGPKQPPSIIQKAGFIYSKEEGFDFLVVGYPIEFKSEMVKRVELFYQQKADRIAKNVIEKPPQKEKKIRPRIPLNKLAYTGNPKK